MTTFAASGDSTTAQGSSWLNHLTDPTLEHVGGVAISGATSSAVLAQSSPVEADVAVIMLGVNDVRLGQTTPSRAATKRNIEAIAALSPASRVLLCAIAPCDVTDYGDDHLDRRTLGFALNRDLSQLAADHGWLFADPWSSVRMLSNGYAKGATDDGVHPTEATSVANIAPRMGIYIRQAATV